MRWSNLNWSSGSASGNNYRRHGFHGFICKTPEADRSYDGQTSQGQDHALLDNSLSGYLRPSWRNQWTTLDNISTIRILDAGSGRQKIIPSDKWKRRGERAIRSDIGWYLYLDYQMLQTCLSGETSNLLLTNASLANRKLSLMLTPKIKLNSITRENSVINMKVAPVSRRLNLLKLSLSPRH